MFQLCSMQPLFSQPNLILALIECGIRNPNEHSSQQGSDAPDKLLIRQWRMEH